MEKHSKGLICNLLYYIVILAAVLGMIIIVGSGAMLVLNVLYLVSNYNAPALVIIPIRGIPAILIYLVIAGIMSLIEKKLLSARIKLRQQIDFNEEGMSKRFASYDMLSAKEKAEFDKERLMEVERLVDSSTLRKITHQGSNSPELDMENLIGLEKVKEEMSTMAARMKYENMKKKEKGKLKNKQQQEQLSMHMCFLGPPGTGKTTCARIMAGFLYKYGYIKQNKCIEIDGNFLRGQYKGETSQKTELIIRKAMGGVLFIDEAYSILEDSGAGYAQEAVATIVKQMEDRRGDFVIIFAGYDNEMKALINSNPGLFSRIKYYLWFGNYSNEELSEIFKFMARDSGFDVTNGALSKFRNKMERERHTRNFGNARTVRNCLEKAIDKHAINFINHKINENYKDIICEEDIETDTRENNFFDEYTE